MKEVVFDEEEALVDAGDLAGGGSIAFFAEGGVPVAELAVGLDDGGEFLGFAFGEELVFQDTLQGQDSTRQPAFLARQQKSISSM